MSIPIYLVLKWYRCDVALVSSKAPMSDNLWLLSTTAILRALSPSLSLSSQFTVWIAHELIYFRVHPLEAAVRLEGDLKGDALLGQIGNLSLRLICEENELPDSIRYVLIAFLTDKQVAESCLMRNACIFLCRREPLKVDWRLSWTVAIWYFWILFLRQVVCRLIL